MLCSQGCWRWWRGAIQITLIALMQRVGKIVKVLVVLSIAQETTVPKTAQVHLVGISVMP